MGTIVNGISSFAIGIASYHIGNLAVQGLSNTLGLVTLRHGTNPLSWLSIQIFGGRTQFGGSSIGGEYSGSKYASQNTNRFYMAPDSDYWGSDKEFRAIDPEKAFVERDGKKIDLLEERPTVEKLLGSAPLGLAWLRNKGYMRLLPKDYAMKSNVNIAQKIIGEAGHSIFKALAIALFAVPSGMLIPTIKFRMPEESLKNFDPDASYPPGMACSSTENVGPWHIGLRGIIWNSLTPKTFSRMLDHPTRVICGIAEIAFCSLTAFYLYSRFPAFVTSHKIAILAGGLLAALS